MIRTKKAKAARTRLEKVRAAFNAAIENNNEMKRGDEVLTEIDRLTLELANIEAGKELARMKLTKPFRNYAQSKNGTYSSKNAEHYSLLLKSFARIELHITRSNSRLLELQELTYVDPESFAKDVEKERLHYDNVILEETARIKEKADKKFAREKADRELASIPVFIFSKESRNGRRFLISDLLEKMKKRKGFITFINQDYVGGIPAKEFLYIFRLHTKATIGEINFAPRDAANRVNGFIAYNGGHSKFSFIAHELDEHDIVSIVEFTN